MKRPGIINKKRIGYTQVILGILLIISTLIAVIFVTRNFINNQSQTEQQVQLLMNQNGVSSELNTTSGQIFLNSLLTRVMMGTYNLVLLISLELIIIILSLIMILQGLVNIKEDNY